MIRLEEDARICIAVKTKRTARSALGHHLQTSVLGRDGGPQRITEEPSRRCRETDLDTSKSEEEGRRKEKKRK